MSFHNTLFVAAAFSLAVFAESAIANDETASFDAALSCVNPGGNVRLIDTSKTASGLPAGVRELVSAMVELPLNKAEDLEGAQRRINASNDVLCTLDLSKIGSIKDFKVQYKVGGGSDWTDFSQDTNFVNGDVPFTITYNTDQPVAKKVLWVIHEKAFASSGGSHDVYDIRFVVHY